LFSLPWADGYSYILATKEAFHEIGWLKAKLIRWLHLERFVGTVYCTDTDGLRLLSEKVERAYKNASLSYKQIVSLSDTLLTLHQPSLDPFQKLVTSYALIIISSRVKSQADLSDKAGFARYGTLQAEKFLEEQSSRELGAEMCLKLYNEAPAHSKEVIGAFFARIQETASEGIAQSVCVQYFVARFQSFYNQEKKPSPSALAAWFKDILKEITEQFQKQAKDLEVALICSMREKVPSENLKESFQAYGVFVAEGLQGKITDSFKEKAVSLKKLFPDDDFSLVMEGMMERKGVQYCQAVAQEMRGDLSVLFPAFEDQARLNFSTASRQIVQGVIRELLSQVDSQRIGAFCKRVADIFVRIYQGQRKEFSVFEPLLGTDIIVQKPVANEATRSSLRDKRGIVKQTSEESLWSNISKTMASKPQIPNAFLKIETNIVANMVEQAPEFAQYYGVFLAKKIKEVSQVATVHKVEANPDFAAVAGCQEILMPQLCEQLQQVSQNEKEWKKFYDVYIHQYFPRHAESMLKAMKKELEKPPEQRASTPPVWS
jgi:hypothetical protein